MNSTLYINSFVIVVCLLTLFVNIVYNCVDELSAGLFAIIEFTMEDIRFYK